MGSVTSIGNTFASDGTLGTIAISSPSNARVSDDSYATAALLLGQVSNYLKVTNLQLNIPTDCTVTGVVVNVERNATSLNGISDSSVRLVKGGSIVGDDKASGTTWTTADVVANYGSLVDMWGVTLTPSEVNATDFGIVINAQASLAATANIDSVSVTVYYSGGHYPCYQNTGMRLFADNGMSSVGAVY